MPPTPYGRRPIRRGGAMPAPLRWLLGLNPLHSWLVVMAVIVGLSLIGLRWLAILVALVWGAYAVYTWLSPRVRGKLRRWLAQARFPRQ